MALVWFDAHGDLNTPANSPSGHFHGMPLRTICGEGDPAILKECFSILSGDQVILAGGRQFDPPEQIFINKNRIPNLSCSTLESKTAVLSDVIVKKGFKHVYIHIDLDVLDPKTYTNIKHPTPGGISIDTLQSHIRDLSKRLDVVGMGIVEFVPKNGSGLQEIEQIIHEFTL